MAYVYILKCSDNTYYTGWTTDPVHRLAAHNSGKGAKYTHPRLPVAIAYLEQVADKSRALKKEYAIKKLTRRQKELLIDTYNKAAKDTSLYAITYLSRQALPSIDSIPLFYLDPATCPIKPKKKKENC